MIEAYDLSKRGIFGVEEPTATPLNDAASQFGRNLRKFPRVIQVPKSLMSVVAT